MGYRWFGNTPRSRYEDSPRPVETPDVDADELDDPRWLDDNNDFAAGASGRQPRNRSHRWERP